MEFVGRGRAGTADARSEPYLRRISAVEDLDELALPQPVPQPLPALEPGFGPDPESCRRQRAGETLQAAVDQQAPVDRVQPRGEVEETPDRIVRGEARAHARLDVRPRA